MIVDLIIIVLVLLGAFSGYRKGLVGILVSIVGLIIAIALAFMLQSSVANFLNSSTGIGTSINQTVTTGIKQALNSGNEDQKDTNDFYSSIVKEITNEDQIKEAANSVTLFILKGISFIIIFIVVIIIFYIIQMILNLVFNLPILDIVNKIGGIGAGALKSVIGIWILLAIVSFLSPIPFMSSALAYVNSSTIGHFLYSHNLFVSIIIATIK